MPDDLQIPIVTAAPDGRAPISATYRPRAAGFRASRAVPVRTMAMAGAAGCGLLLAAVGGWALLHRHPAAVPVIEADSRPVRVKPENPGGMTLADPDEAATGPGEQRMAPAAEAPAPQALRAQMQPPPATPSSAPPAPALPTQQALALPPTTPATPPNVSPLPDTPRPAAPSAAAARPAPAPAAVSARPAPAGNTTVQVAAVDSEAAAQSEWQRLQKRMPDLLNDRRPTTQKAERDGHPIWRVRIGGFADIADATGFCAKLRARGGNCAIASF